MVCKFFNLSSRRVVSVLLMSVIMLLSFIPSVFAVPGTSSDVPGNAGKLGWIDISATVPEGFSGSVFVQVMNTADDSYYDVECFVLNDFKNSSQVPLGNYEVVAVNTSENPFLYYATCETEEFELTGTYSLHVVVEKVADSDAVLAETIEGQEDMSDPEEEEESDSGEPADLAADEKTENVEDEGSSKASEDKGSQESKEGNSSKSPYSLLISFGFSLLLLIVVAFVLWRLKNR